MPLPPARRTASTSFMLGIISGSVWTFLFETTDTHQVTDRERQ